MHSQVCAAVEQVNRAFQQHKLQLFHQVLAVTLTVSAACLPRLVFQTHVFTSAAQQVSFGIQEPDPHISVAWLLGDQQTRLQQHLDAHKPVGPNWEQSVNQILCTVGQKHYCVWSSTG